MCGCQNNNSLSSLSLYGESDDDIDGVGRITARRVLLNAGVGVVSASYVPVSVGYLGYKTYTQLSHHHPSRKLASSVTDLFLWGLGYTVAQSLK